MSCFTVLLLLSLSSLGLSGSSSDLTFHIVPTLASPTYCDHVHCLTFSQFAGNIGRYVGSNTTLYIDEGMHVLNESFSVSNVTKFSMTGNDGSSKSVNITCNEGANFKLSSISRVHIQGLVFANCGGNRIEAVDLLTINNSMFVGKNSN